MSLATLLFVAFTLLSTAGAYLIGARFKSRTFGVAFAAGVLLFFVALFLGVLWLLRSSGLG